MGKAPVPIKDAGSQTAECIFVTVRNFCRRLVKKPTTVPRHQPLQDEIGVEQHLEFVVVTEKNVPLEG